MDKKNRHKKKAENKRKMNSSVSLTNNNNAGHFQAMKLEIKRGLELIDSTVNTLAQAKWIFTSVMEKIKDSKINKNIKQDSSSSSSCSTCCDSDSEQSTHISLPIKKPTPSRRISTPPSTIIAQKSTPKTSRKAKPRSPSKKSGAASQKYLSEKFTSRYKSGQNPENYLNDLTVDKIKLLNTEKFILIKLNDCKSQGNSSLFSPVKVDNSKKTESNSRKRKYSEEINKKVIKKPRPGPKSKSKNVVKEEKSDASSISTFSVKSIKSKVSELFNNDENTEKDEQKNSLSRFEELLKLTKPINPVKIYKNDDKIEQKTLNKSEENIQEKPRIKPKIGPKSKMQKPEIISVSKKLSETIPNTDSIRKKLLESFRQFQAKSVVSEVSSENGKNDEKIVENGNILEELKLFSKQDPSGLLSFDQIWNNKIHDFCHNLTTGTETEDKVVIDDIDEESLQINNYYLIAKENHPLRLMRYEGPEENASLFTPLDLTKLPKDQFLQLFTQITKQ